MAAVTVVYRMTYLSSHVYVIKYKSDLLYSCALQCYSGLR